MKRLEMKDLHFADCEFLLDKLSCVDGQVMQNETETDFEIVDCSEHDHADKGGDFTGATNEDR